MGVAESERRRGGFLRRLARQPARGPSAATGLRPRVSPEFTVSWAAWLGGGHDAAGSPAVSFLFFLNEHQFPFLPVMMRIAVCAHWSTLNILEKKEWVDERKLNYKLET